MKKIDVVEVCSRDNEVHFILLEQGNSKRPRKRIDLGEREVKKIMKREAAKPLLLLRAE